MDEHIINEIEDSGISFKYDYEPPQYRLWDVIKKSIREEAEKSAKKIIRIGFEIFRGAVIGLMFLAIPLAPILVVYALYGPVKMFERPSCTCPCCAKEVKR